MSVSGAPVAGVMPRRANPRNGALGMAIFVFTEIMLFAGFISAFVIVRASAVPGMWPPPDQPRLPVARTMLNTVALLASGVALWWGGRVFRKSGARAAGPWIGAALALGSAFVIFQGLEWVALLKQGLTITSSQLGAFFYVIIGTHALHAVAAILALAFCWLGLRSGKVTESRLAAVSVFWYFVVLVWPLLYWQVYR